MAVMKADMELCKGYASCMVVADDVFDLDDEGLVAVVRKEIPESDMARMQEAVLVCPVAALKIEES
ncbi:ferredoxin [Streptomyces coeruleorubidus]|uniref:ferredoxin n=1 Tax=Streptomyces coeruleorubidus TaxID=116188 RepID=UPI0037010723